MVRNCSVRGCKRKRTTHPGMKMYKFPGNETLKRIWEEFCDSQKGIPKSGIICDAHFEEKFKIKNAIEEMYSLTPKRSRRDLTDDAVPTLNGPNILILEDETEQGSLLDTTSVARNDQKNMNEDAADIAANKESSPMFRIDQIIEKNEQVLQSSFCHPEIIAGANSELFNLRQVKRNLTSEKTQLERNAKALNENYEILKVKLEKSEEERQSLLEGNQKLLALTHQLMQEKIKLDIENKRLHNELNNIKHVNTKYEEVLQKYFTPGQLKHLLSDTSNKRLRWSCEDIASAISLRCASIKGYRYLKYKRFHPLPHVRTLRRWAQKVSVEDGIMEIVVSLMRQKGNTLSEQERLTVLSYDEMSLDSFYCYDRLTDTVYGETDKVQVVMARGLIHNWKQPIAFYYDTDMSKEIMLNILRRLHDINFDVVGIVSDLGGSNRSFLSELKITNEFSSFVHPSDTTKRVFCFSDVPHLIKLFRNHYLDDGYILNGTEIRKDVIEKLLAVTQTELNINHKLSQLRHLDVKGNARQAVKPAAQLISPKTADMIDYCCQKNLIQVRNHQTVSKVFRVVGNFFNLLNNMDQRDKIKDVEAYGLSLDKQNAELDECVQVVSKIRQIKKLKSGKNTESLLPFQKGIIMTIKSLKDMYVYLKQRYDIKYILTKRLNQDCLENFFGYIRGMGGQNDHPLPTDFKYRMKLYILGRHHSAVFTMNRNTSEIVDEECLITPSKSFAPFPTSTPQDPKVATNSTEVFQNQSDDSAPPLQDIDDHFLDCSVDDEANLLIIDLGKVYDEDSEEAMDKEQRQDEERERRDEEGEATRKEEEKEEEDLINQKREEEAVERIWKVLIKDATTAEEKLEQEGFEYLAGYVGHRYRSKYVYLGKKTDECSDDGSWLQMISKGNLLKPAEEFLTVLQSVEAVFLKVHGMDKSFMKTGPNAIGSILKQAQHFLKLKFTEDILKRYPTEVIKCYIRVRMFIRICNCNERLKANKLKKTNDKKFNNKNNKLGK